MSATTAEQSDRLRPTADAGDGVVLEIPADAHTLSGFLRWEDSDAYPRRGRIDFLGGRLFIDMAAGEIHSHETLKARVGLAVGNVVSERKLGKFFIDNVRYVHREADSGVEPDVLVCLYESIRAGRLRFTESEKGGSRCMSVEGSADLVVEIVSDSSVAKDTSRLRDSYFVAGVREYWILDARGMRLTFALLTQGAENWIEAARDADGFRRSGILGQRVRVDRVTDEVGYPDYDVKFRE